MKVRNLLTAAAALLLTIAAQPVFAAAVTIAWNPAADADVAGYIVRYGTRPGEYAAQVNVGKATTFKAEDLVVGQTYYFTVQAYAADGSTSAPASELPAVVIGASRGVASRLLTPDRDATNVTSAQVFAWEQVANADAYVFSIGTRPGGRDVVDSGETKRTWWVADALPPGARLFARVRTRVGERWSSTDLSFESAPTARMVYPFEGASDISASERFVWSAVTGAQAYRLLVGTTPGGSDLGDSGETDATSFALQRHPARARRCTPRWRRSSPASGPLMPSGSPLRRRRASPGQWPSTGRISVAASPGPRFSARMVIACVSGRRRTPTTCSTRVRRSRAPSQRRRCPRVSRCTRASRPASRGNGRSAP